MKKEGLIIVVVLLITIAFAFALYYTFRPNPCETYQCYAEYMNVCARAAYVNEEPEASWLYTIQRKTEEGCEIKVTLLQAKEGDLNLRGFEGHSMVCMYPLGMIAYADKDMSRCHGLLKEDLQSLIIEKLHQYLINNIGDIKDVLKRTGLQ